MLSMATIYFIVLCLILATTTAHIEWGIVNGSIQLPCYTIYPVNWARVSPSNYYTFVINTDVPTHVYSGKAYLSYSANYKNLTLTNLTIDDTGNYQCIEHLAKQTIRQPLITLMVVNPSIINVVINATVGDTVELPCAFESAMWSLCKNNTLTTLLQDTTKNLMLYNVSQSDSGIYYCFKGTLSYGMKLSVNPIRTTIVECTSIQAISVDIYYIIITILAISTLLLICILAIVLCRQQTYTTLPMYK